MKIQRVKSVLYKQFMDTLRNKAILIQFLMFPIMALILTLSSESMGLEKHYFIVLFTVMYISMAPIIVISANVSEDKEKGGLLSLRMANVKPLEYSVGVMCYVLILCFLGVCILSFFGGFSSFQQSLFIISGGGGLLVSSFIGSIIGVTSKNQSAASGLAVPSMLVFSFLPMIAQFNPSIMKVSRFIYTQQISNIMNGAGTSFSWVVVWINLSVFLVVYIIISRKRVL